MILIKSHYVKKIILLLIVLITSSCGGGYSPWETEVDCKDYYQDNLKRLAEIEAATSGQQAFRVAMITDLHNEISDIKAAVDRINQRDDIAFTIITGDITDQGLAIEYELACNETTKLKTPRFYVISNHDSISFGKEIFRENFAPYHYAFKYKDVKFIMYNDNVFEFPDAPDYAFLTNEATVQGGETRRKTVGVAHVPPDSSVRSEEDATTLRQFLFDNNFHLTMHGHHNKFRYWLDEFTTPHYVTAKVEGGKYGVLSVAADDTLSLQNCAATCTDAVLE